MARRGWRPDPRKAAARDKRLFTLDVFLIGGPMTEEFAKQNRVISRTIQIRGDQTLEDLHHAIFDALDREEEHMYEFQFGKGPHDRKGKRYVLPMAADDPFSGGPKIAGVVSRTTIGSLDLAVDQAFGYWFDFGDDWWHQINVVAIEEQAPRGKYPKVTKRVGASPPQYPDWDEEGDDWEAEEDHDDDDET
jgi:hypothetical protein